LVVDGNEFDLPDAKDIIMNCDADAAQKVISKNEAFFRKCLGYMYTPQVMETTMALLLGKFGVKPLVPESVAKNWNLSHVDKVGAVTWGSLPSNYRWAHWLPGVMK
jgi:hypothetical protein